MRRWGPIVVLALLPVLVLWRCIFHGETLGPWNQVRTFAPWSEAAPNAPFDVLQMDAALQFYIWRDLVFESWNSGQVPLYNPYSLGGTALAGNSQSGAFYPPHILMGFLGVPTGAAITLLAWFHLFWAGLGVYLLCRRMDGLTIPAMIAGGGFALSPFMLSWVGIASVPTTVSWFPWVFLGLISIFTPNRERFAWLPMAGTSAAVGMMILAGHLQFVAYGMLGAGLVYISLTIARRNWRGAVAGAASMTCGILVALPHLKQVLEWSEFSHRRGVPTEAGFQAYAASSLKWWEFASIGTPDLLGSPSRSAGDPFMPLSTFWAALVKQGANYAESSISVGAIVLCLSLVTLRSRTPYAIIFGGLATLALLLSTASPLARALYFGFPGWSATGSPGRAGILLVLALCILAGLFKPSDREADTAPLKDPQNQMILFGLALVGVLSIGVRMLAPGFASWNLGIDQEFLRAYIQANMSPAHGLTFAVVSIGCLAYGLGKSRASWGRWLAVGGIVSLVPTLLTISPPSGRPPVLTHDIGSERVAILNQNWELLILPKSTLPPNLAVLGRVSEIGGYDSLVHRSAVERLRTINSGDPAPPANGNMMLVKSDERRDDLAAAGVTRIWSSAPLPGSVPRSLGGTEIFESRIQGPGLASLDGTAVATTRLTMSGAVMSTKGPGELTIRLQPLPSTKLLVNGRITPFSMKGGWPTVDLPPGDHTIELGAELNPLLMMGFLLPVIFGLIGLVQNRRTQQESSAESA